MLTNVPSARGGTVRHELGTDYERALSEFGTHRDLAANRHSAAQAIRRHAEHQQTSVANVYWLEYSDHRIRPVVVNFAAGTHCWMSWGWFATTRSTSLEPTRRTASGPLAP
jgi:hypothetical protein